MTTLARAVARGRSGVFRIDAGKLGDLPTLAREAGLALHRVDLSRASGKAELLAAFSRELRFPAWVGDNWDALQDALCDLSWLPETRGIVVVLEGIAPLQRAAPGELDVAIDVLTSTAASWESENRPFLALVAGPSPATLPLLR